MPSENNMPLTLVIITPEGALPEIKCNSINLCVADNEKGKGGGSYGIKKGHAEALIALSSGTVKAYIDGKTVYECTLSGGFAKISKNTVTITGNKS